MQKVLCFGEMLLRFSPAAEGASLQAQQMPVFIGGAELNVAHALASWQTQVAYCTAAPDNFLTTSILGELEKKNIDCSPVHHSGNRLGVYYLLQGTDMKHEGVVFDRAGSSFACLQPGMIDWDKTLEGISWFHFSAIAASLTLSAAAVCLEAIKAAKRVGITVSIDLNYREKLWMYERIPHEIMQPLLPFCDVVMGNMWAVEKLLNIPAPLQSSNGKTAEELIVACKENILSLQSTFPQAHTIAYTLRLQDTYQAILYQEKTFAISKMHNITDVIDRVGSGDCFMGGIIYSSLENMQSEEAINFAAAAAVGKLYEKGDTTSQTVGDVKKRY